MTIEGVNPATALYRVLRKLSECGAATVDTGWGTVLDVAAQPAEFARRHSEVVGLFRQVHSYLLALPDADEDRERYLQYIPSWYRAVVLPGAWTGTQSNNVVKPEILEHLGGLGSSIRKSSPRSVIEDDAIEALRASLEHWRSLAEDADLPHYLAEEIRAHLHHIDWLLANVATFGTRPVVDEATLLLASGVKTLKARPKLKTKVASAMAGVIFFLGGASHVVDEMNGVLEGLVETRGHIEHLIEGSKQIEQKKPLQLTAGVSPNGDEPPQSPTPKQGSRAEGSSSSEGVE